MITIDYNEQLEIFEVFSGTTLIAVEKTEVAAKTVAELVAAAEECALARF
jgi:hypothetical protein